MSSSDPTDRHMNDTTMPPPAPRQAAAATAAATDGTRVSVATRAPRHQTALRKGFGLSDWNKLLRSTKDLAQLKGQAVRRNISWSEIKQHNQPHDGWVVLRAKVYHLSPYLPYHPGGEAILRKVLGKDITALYDKYHGWVNEQGLIGKLLIGYVDTSRRTSGNASSSYLPSSVSSMAAPRPKAAVVSQIKTAALGSNKSNDNEEESDEEEDLWDA